MERPELNSPVVLMVLGRQRVGKTSFLNAIAQFLKAQGAVFEIWDGDLQNTSYNLSVFHKEARKPEATDPEDVKAWLEERFMDVVERRVSAILDIGGGDTPLGRLVQDVPVSEMLEEAGVRVVLVHVIGPETPDLDYLERFSADNLFVSRHTLVVLNAGLVLSGRSLHAAFAQTVGHPTIEAAVRGGAKLIRMPRLACMSEVTDRGLTFEEAIAGKIGERHQALNMFDKARVRRWWDEDLPKMFSAIPSEWLPAMRDGQAYDAAE